jgi:hypothetical protein
LSRALTLIVARHRIDRLKRDLIKEIPRFPNDKAALEHAQRKHVQVLIIDYLAWRSRFIAPRPREIALADTVTNDKRWEGNSERINLLLAKIKDGADLTPHLSSLVKKGGSAIPADLWSDKDMVLNVAGFHHLHLDVAGQGSYDDHNLLLFAEINRTQFKAIALFDHSVFDAGTQENGRLHDEHERAVSGGKPGFYLMSAVTVSGHSEMIVDQALSCMRLINSIDPKLDDLVYLTTLFERAKIDPPKKPKLSWKFWYSDLLVYSKDPEFGWLVLAGNN